MSDYGARPRSWFPFSHRAAARFARPREISLAALQRGLRWHGVALVALLVIAWTTGLAVWLVPTYLAFLAARGLGRFAARHIRPGRVVAWELLPGGLSEVMADGRRRNHPWDSIREWRRTPEAVTVRTPARTLQFTGRDVDRDDLVRAIEDHLAQRLASTGSLSPVQIAAWLGIEEGERLRLSLPWWKGPAVGNWLLGLTVFQVVVGLLDGNREMLRWNVPLLLCYWQLLFASWVGKAVTVTEYGLEGQGHRIGWDEIQGIHDSDLKVSVAEVAVRAGERSICLRGPLRHRVAEVAERVLKAKQAGAVLPRMDGVPETALSRAESVEVNAERGISRAEDQP